MSRVRALSWIPAFAGMTMVAGCMVGPDYKRPDLDLPAGYTEPASNATPSIPARWWTLYGDPVLDGMIAQGLERNADVKLAVARVEEAEAALREARATVFFPLVNGNAGAIVVPRTKPIAVVGFTIAHGRIVEIDLIADPAKLPQL